MQYMKLKNIIYGTIVLLSVAGLVIADDTAPDLPPGCEALEVQAGNKVSFHTYALGVQRYRWNGAAWVFVEPVARLFANENYRGETGIHYGGPTWESISGSRVIATREAGCNVDPTAIDWLLLRAVSNEGHGPFKHVTFIQRVNTVGGKAPVAPGSIVGSLIDVPYTTEYFFYRAEN